MTINTDLLQAALASALFGALLMLAVQMWMVVWHNRPSRSRTRARGRSDYEHAVHALAVPLTRVPSRPAPPLPSEYSDLWVLRDVAVPSESRRPLAPAEQRYAQLRAIGGAA